MSEKEAILDLRDLAVEFESPQGWVRAVDGVSLSVAPGQTLGIVGESGCGKSVTAMSIVDLLPKPMGRVANGEVLYKGRDLRKLSNKELYKVRGKEISYIFQEPMTALNPVHKIGKQISEVLLLHTKMSKKDAWEASVKVLASVGIPAPEQRANEYPHQLSGGMRQRVVIAMALVAQPELLIADEPTTALDVTVQAEILELIKSLQTEHGMAVIMITHDLGVIAETCDAVVVMYAGRVVEKASVHNIFKNPRHAYTKALLASIPKLDLPGKSELTTIPGTVAAIHDFVEGCRFCQRMGRAPENPERPRFIEVAPGHWVEDCPHCHQG